MSYIENSLFHLKYLLISREEGFLSSDLSRKGEIGDMREFWINRDKWDVINHVRTFWVIEIIGVEAVVM
jgi:hypothetical protein